jgi:hypothetical protein
VDPRSEDDALPLGHILWVLLGGYGEDFALVASESLGQGLLVDVLLLDGVGEDRV